MEKYRRWTDQRAGVNPFVQPKKETLSLIGNILLIVAVIIKSLIFIPYLPLFLILYSIPIDWLRRGAARVLLGLLGVYEMEDFGLQKAGRQGQCTRILSNHSCFIDIVYYLYRYPGYSFLAYSQHQDSTVKYHLFTPLKAFLLAITTVQPFYSLGTTGKYGTLKQLIQQEFKGDKNNARFIIFYEQIRTNGKGTIRAGKKLCEDIYDLGEDCLIAQIKYFPRRNELFSLTRSGLGLLLRALGTVSPGNNIKVKASRQSKSDGMKMLETPIRVGS